MTVLVSQATAQAAVVTIAAVVTVIVVATVTVRLRALRKRRQAMDGARMIGRFRAAAFELYQEAADQEFADILRDLDKEGK